MADLTGPGIEQLAELRARSNGTVDDKGKLTLPPKPDAGDRDGLCVWLTGVLGLTPEHPVVAGRRFGGANGSAVLERRGTRDIHFNPYSRLTNAARFRETICGQLRDRDGQLPGFKNEHLHQIEHVVRMLAAGFEAEDDAAVTDGIISTFLHDAERAEEGHTTYGTSQERYAAAVALRPGGDFARMPRYLVDRDTGEYVVRVSDMAYAARRHTGNTMPSDVLDARIAEYGWERVQLRGWEKSGRAGRADGGHARVSVYRGHLVGGENDA